MSMPDDKYLSPEGYHVDTNEVFDDGAEGFCVLVVQYNEDKDAHRCQLSASPDFADTDPAIVLDRNLWIYAFWQAPSGRRFIIHSNDVVEADRDGAFEVIARANVGLTGIYGRSEEEVYLVGLDGYVGRLSDGEIVDLPIRESADINEVTISPDGTVYAVGEFGGLFRLDGETWTQIDLGIGLDLLGALAVGEDDVLLCGANGFCGRYRNEELITYDPPDERNYYAIAIFQGDVYFGAGFLGVDRLDGTTVAPFKDIAYAYNMRASDKYLYTSGLNRVGRFDGTGWLKCDYL